MPGWVTIVAGADGLVVDVERERARRSRACAGSAFGPSTANSAARTCWPAVMSRSGVDRLQVGADPVERVVESPVLDVEAVPAGDAAVGVEDAFGVGGVELDAGRDRVGAAVDRDARRLGDVGAVGKYT